MKKKFAFNKLNFILCSKNLKMGYCTSSESFPEAVDASWLKKNAEKTRIFDCSYYLSGRDVSQEFKSKHIPNSLFFGLDDIADKTKTIKIDGKEQTLPHM